MSKKMNPFNRRLWLLCLFLAFAMAGCVQATRAANYQPLTVSFNWAGGGLSAPSPEIRVTNVPAGTAFFQVKMTDLDMPGFNHGGGTVPNDNGLIPAGTLRSFRGPEPPAGQKHTYAIKVIALSADKSVVLGEGQAQRSYP